MEELAQVYARALLEVALEQGKLDVLREQLTQLADAVEANRTASKAAAILPSPCTESMALSATNKPRPRTATMTVVACLWPLSTSCFNILAYLHRRCSGGERSARWTSSFS